ncbi:MAG: YbaK/EbsC family protein [Peptostreptococcaceae bacterium]|nr:YbaK/EbsC family protein [Peptostreptococcaceae bacterium]
MSIEKVRKYFERYEMADKVLEFEESSATVELAAQRLGVIPARIAKTLSFSLGERCVLIVAAGDAKIDSKKFKTFFGKKANMLKSEDVERMTGHGVGGVCPFDNPASVDTFIDVSIRRFETVFPACGSAKSAIELTPEQVFRFGEALEWVDICKDWREVPVD